MHIKDHIFLLLLLLPPNVAAQQEADRSAVISPTSIILIIITILFFLTGTAAVVFRHISDNCFVINAITGGRNAAARGLDAETIESLPTYLYSDPELHRHVGKVDPECAVCLCEFEDNEELRLLPECCHVFHPQCIDPWLASHVTCPICRHNLEIQETAQSSDDPEPHAVISILLSGHESDGPDRSVGVDLDDHDLSDDEKKRNVWKFRRSHSTGHSLVDVERFRNNKLPDEVQNRLINRSGQPGELLNSMVSPRNGYRRSGWFSMTPPITHPRPGSVWSPILPVCLPKINLTHSPV